ncbi:uncharacterized protein LY89DRAFT_780856 [Mollisia scopiformis]|uniref:Uncharacterized protein n=1 Tax=Mollisia scopiformis TaxID=149040 RepID=A0A194XFF0_MOLSC|nr:uncharacterized protein LY89DRAFT_780856 [Mollisia scopiformis]KUJ18871.1 hypothetical protein LY89DRAFT_780856 [Mollisia scopiformis]
MLLLYRYIFLPSLLVPSVLGYTTFTPNCSSLAEPVNFVFSTSSRSTLDILWSCLFTLIACTWTILHLNVPEQRGDQDPGWIGDCKWFLKGIWMKTKWMILTMLAPELLLSISLGALVHAKEVNELLKKFIEEDGVEWSLTHGMFLNMGGFVIQAVENDSISSIQPIYTGPPGFVTPEGSGGLKRRQTSPATITSDGSHEELQDTARTSYRNNQWTALQDIDPIASPNQDRPSTDVGTQRASENWSQDSRGMDPRTESGLEVRYSDEPSEFLAPECYHLTADQLYMLRDKKILKRLPAITKEELNARSKSDAFSKAIAMGQIFWMAFQVIVRAARHLAISQLELAVAAFSVCGIFIYASSWNKPKDVQIPLPILRYPAAVPADLVRQLGEYAEVEYSAFSMSEFVPLPKWVRTPQYDGSIVSNSTVWDGKESYTGYMGTEMGLTLGGVIFGVLHVLAWNFHFPSEIERNLWRASSVICTCLPVLFLCITYLFSRALEVELGARILGRIEDIIRAELATSIAFVFFVVYSLARLYILIEIFRTLCFLPVDAYTATWAASIPHVS